jgi:hypothetical protein
MKQVVLSCAALAAATLAAPANAADASGAWHVSGKIATFAYTLNCQFKVDGGRLGGVCVDASNSDPRIKPGKAHALTAGSVAGDKVSWTYGFSVLLNKFDVTYSGVQSGERMSGSITVGSHEGSFTATRP